MFYWTGGDSGNEYRVATLSKFYPATTGITMPSLESIGQFRSWKGIEVAGFVPIL